jgi:hypothetical protein
MIHNDGTPRTSRKFHENVEVTRCRPLRPRKRDISPLIQHLAIVIDIEVFKATSLNGLLEIHIDLQAGVSKLE